MTLARGLILACGVALASSDVVAAQAVRPGYTAPTDGRLVIEGLFGRQHLPAIDAPARRNTLDGLGGRILWALGPLDEPVSTWQQRVLLGGFVLRASSPELAASTLHAGAQADLRLRRVSTLARVEPLLSMSVGVLRSQTRERTYSALPRLRRPDAPALDAGPLPHPTFAAAPGTKRWESLTLTPGVGAWARLSPDFALRLDVRNVIVFEAPVRSAPELVGGLSLRL